MLVLVFSFCLFPALRFIIITVKLKKFPPFKVHLRSFRSILDPKLVKLSHFLKDKTGAVYEIRNNHNSS